MFAFNDLPEGRVVAQLRHSADAFKAGTQVLAFNNLPEGRYAAQLRHSGDAVEPESRC